MTDTEGAKPRARVIVIGGGFGGLNAVRALRNSPVDIILIDRTNHHLFQPMLYQVATGVVNASDIAAPLRELLHDQENVLVLMGSVTSVDVNARTVTVEGHDVPYPYDYLVLATGATDNYFGHPEWRQYAPPMKSLSDALHLRERTLKSFELAEIVDDLEERRRLTTFVIVGGGPTGVELAGTLSEMFRITLKGRYRHDHPSEAKVILVDAGPRLLAPFAEKTSAQVQKRLEKMGVEVRLHAMAQTIDEDGIIIDGQRIESRNVFWAAGVKASPAAAWIGVEADRGGHIKVLPDLSVPGHPEIFAVGDTALIIGKDGKPLPGVAQVAMQSGAYAGRMIQARQAGAQAMTPEPFSYFDKGSMATVSRYAAVMETKRFKTTGLFGKLGWAFIHLAYISGMGNRLRTFLSWTWNTISGSRTAMYLIEPSGVRERDSLDTIFSSSNGASPAPAQPAAPAAPANP